MISIFHSFFSSLQNSQKSLKNNRNIVRRSILLSDLRRISKKKGLKKKLEIGPIDRIIRHFEDFMFGLCSGRHLNWDQPLKHLFLKYRKNTDSVWDL
jgi:hypothetical protein